jgi:hypothetical protein
MITKTTAEILLDETLDLNIVWIRKDSIEEK